MDTDYRSILLVDDDAEYLAALKALLEPVGHHIHCAESGEAGLAILEDIPMDLVISDMNMPNMSGDEFLSEVAAKWPETERIGMTASVESEVTVRAINKGKVSRFLLKPWEDDEMLQAVEKCLQLGQLKRENEQLHELTLESNKQLKNSPVNWPVPLKTGLPGCYIAIPSLRAVTVQWCGCFPH
ncbi:response regulator [Aliamphritea spongicola]|nr:response regulator [Aliamphritea spongicola]